MIPKKERLTRSLWSKYIVGRPIKQVVTPLAIVKVYPAEVGAVAVVISKKNEKSAVKRNKTKRRFVVVYKKMKNKKNIYVFLITKAGISASLIDIEKNFSNFPI